MLLNWLPRFGELKPVAIMTFLLVLAWAIIRQWRGAVLTAVAVPVAIGLTEYALKPSVGEAIGQAFPSGHATSAFAVAAVVEQSLSQAGLARPQVGFRRVGALDRDPMTRKARRFIPLSARIP